MAQNCIKLASTFVITIIIKMNLFRKLWTLDDSKNIVSRLSVLSIIFLLRRIMEI